MSQSYDHKRLQDLNNRADGIERTAEKIRSIRLAYEEKIAQGNTSDYERNPGEARLPKVNSPEWLEQNRSALSPREQARIINHNKTMKQIEALGASDPGREYTNQSLERLGYRDGAGIDPSKAREHNRTREYNILHPGASRRAASLLAIHEAKYGNPEEIAAARAQSRSKGNRGFVEMRRAKEESHISNAEINDKNLVGRFFINGDRTTPNTSEINGTIAKIKDKKLKEFLSSLSEAEKGNALACIHGVYSHSGAEGIGIGSGKSRPVIELLTTLKNNEQLTGVRPSEVHVAIRQLNAAKSYDRAGIAQIIENNSGLIASSIAKRNNAPTPEEVARYTKQAEDGLKVAAQFGRELFAQLQLPSASETRIKKA